MYFRPARTLFGLIAVGGAVAVGVITHDAGFTALTFVGGLMLPRILGFRGRHLHGGRAAAGGRGRGRLDQRMESWHRQAHGACRRRQPPAHAAQPAREPGGPGSPPRSRSDLPCAATMTAP